MEKEKKCREIYLGRHSYIPFLSAEPSTVSLKDPLLPSTRPVFNLGVVLGCVGPALEEISSLQVLPSPVFTVLKSYRISLLVSF